MLKLDAIELIGFKSFLEKTRVTLHERVSAVVGPNGCGKSNLADAIGWVLGVQSARSLRGQTMDDVIFSGTGTRKPSGFARVNLTLRNTAEGPIVVDGQELSSETLEIGRKLYRSGESVYSINGRRCRLKDIHRFMEGAGLGFASYALIVQGQIEAFLSARPLERRPLIEEAARITGYKSRRRSAELKLEMAQQNLLRVQDILLEVERQLRSLKRQASRARHYRELQEEFRQVCRRKTAREARLLRSALEELARELEVSKAAEERLREEVAVRERAYQESLERRDRLEVRRGELHQRRSETLLEVDRTENSIRYHQEQMGAAQRQLEAARAERETLKGSLSQVAEELSRFQEERAMLEEEEGRLAAALEEQAGTVSRYDGEIQQTESRLEELRSRLLRLAGETSSLGNVKDQLEQQQKTDLAARQRLEREQAGYSLQLEETGSRLEEKRRLLAEKEEQTGALQGRLQALEGERAGLEQELGELNGRLTELHNQMIGHRERLQSLQEVEVNRSHYSQGVQAVLNYLKGNRSIRTGGTLADFVETDPLFERLVEEFLDEELEYVLVDSLEDAVRGVSELKALPGGRCTFLTLNSTNGFGKEREEVPTPSRQEGVYGTLGDLLQMKPEVEAAFRRVLPQRAEAVVVSDLDRALQLAHSYPESVFLTLEGEALAPRGLLSGLSSQSKKLGLLTLKRQKKDLETRIAQTQKGVGRLRQEERILRGRLQELDLQIQEVRQFLFQLEKDILALGHQQEQLESDARRQEQALRVVEGEIARLETERRRQLDRLRTLGQELSRKGSEQLEAERLLAETQRSQHQLRSEFTRVHEQFHRLAAEGKVLEERRAALERTLSRIEEQRLSLEGRQGRLGEQTRQGEERLSSLQQSQQHLKEDLEKSHQNLAALDVLLEEVDGEYETWRQSHPELEAQLSRLREQRAQAQEKRGQWEVERARLETRQQSLEQQAAEQLSLSLEDVLAHTDPEGVDPQELETSFQTLKTQLDSFGPINMTALEEYQELEERYQFLTRQKRDLEQSIADTTRAILEINRRSREQFQEAFETINHHFREVFERLFGGGEAGMELLEGEDPLESGIDLYAQPPGKKLQNVMLLSGGEKALTVLALLVAIFMYRPSRFCVLDEVDAPLDEANVLRFTGLIQHLSLGTQFILITHNKRTMEIADALYGVTMEEPGVSRVVSVRI